MMRKFGLGQAVARGEDRRFLTGHGRYVGDITLPGQLRALVLRSPHAHADIRAIDCAAALALPGVVAILTGADIVAGGFGDVPCFIPVKSESGGKLPRPGRPLLAKGRVRFVGEPVAFVVAESVAAARDGLDAIAVDYRPLPAVAEMEGAMTPDATAIWPDAPSNLAFYWRHGDRDAVEAALAGAAHQVRLRLVHNRVVPCTMEPRAALGAYDPARDHYTLYTSSQGAHGVRDALCQATLKLTPERLRVVVPDVGGGFGTKAFHYPEEALVLLAARRTGRPVSWTGERSDAFLGDTHGRDQANDIEAGFDVAGRCLALKVETVANMGAYLNGFGPAIPSQMTGCMLSGCYAIPAIFATCRGVYTNTVPVDAYRGAGRPEAAYIIERLLDAAARQLGVAPDDIRRRNFIRPEAMPYRTAAGPTYDSGDFRRNLDDALVAADWAGFERRRRASATQGKLRGIGLSTYVEICGFEGEEATIRFTEDGMVEVLIGTQSTGQGHETAYAQIVVEKLGVPFACVRVVQGDTARIPTGKGTSGSRSLPVGGPAIANACQAVIARARPLAARLLQAEPGQVTFAHGTFRVAGGHREVTLLALAAAVRAPENRPPDDHVPSLDATGHYQLEASTFPNGCHVCEVEIDPETGRPAIVGYHVVDDFGTIVNPALLAGQIQGGVAQGIGQALCEQAIYDPETAQLLTGSFVDYALPRASDVPSIDPTFNVVPCVTNPMGIKGAGEAGTIGACPAVINAILDALAPRGVAHLDMPATPERIWRALREGPRA